jgi:two-component system chemotaxis sensor kinase CheA
MFEMEDEFIKQIQQSFLAEADELLEQAETTWLKIEKTEVSPESFKEVTRIFHNFKGSSKAVGFDELSQFAHRIEDLLSDLAKSKLLLTKEISNIFFECVDELKSSVKTLRKDVAARFQFDRLVQKIGQAKNSAGLPEDLRKVQEDGEAVLHLRKEKQRTVQPILKFERRKEDSDETIRVPLKKIDDLLDTFGEQVIHLSALDFYKDNLEKYKDEVIRVIFSLKKTTLDLQQSTMTLRMINMKSLFSKLERTVRDAAQMTDKKIKCQISGADNELDKIIVDQLSDPLIHLCRNAVDHGIETPRERVDWHKPEEGIISLRARREGVSFVIEIEDDGRGLNLEVIRKKAIEQNLIKSEQVLSKDEILSLIFENGFSTKENTSELSGRGVGMNIVKESIGNLKGTFEIHSDERKGTLFRMKLPLSLSLFNGLLVVIQGQKFIIPSSQVNEIVRTVEVREIEVRAGRKYIQLRDEILELIDLAQILRQGTRVDESDPKRNMILVSQLDRVKVGFIVNQVLSVHRTVQKSISPEMQSCPGASGVTILGDGTPCMILDLRYLKDSHSETY